MTLLVRNIGNKLSDPVSSRTNTKLIEKDRLTRLRAADEKNLCFSGSWWRGGPSIEMMPLQ